MGSQLPPLQNLIASSRVSRAIPRTPRAPANLATLLLRCGLRFIGIALQYHPLVFANCPIDALLVPRFALLVLWFVSLFRHPFFSLVPTHYSLLPAPTHSKQVLRFRVALLFYSGQEFQNDFVRAGVMLSFPEAPLQLGNGIGAAMLNIEADARQRAG